MREWGGGGEFCIREKGDILCVLERGAIVCLKEGVFFVCLGGGGVRERERESLRVLEREEIFCVHEGRRDIFSVCNGEEPFRTRRAMDGETRGRKREMSIKRWSILLCHRHTDRERERGGNE